MIINDIMHRTTEAERREAYEYAQKNYTLILSDDSPLGWDIFGENCGGRWVLYSVAKPNSGGSNSYFGDIPHLIRLFIKGYEKTADLTAAGREICRQYTTLQL